VTVDPSWALWALECAVDRLPASGSPAGRQALRLIAAGVDQLYLAQRDGIDRQRLNSALDRIGNQGSAKFRRRLADAFDSLEPAVVA
jgi:hypothetical protein